MTVLVGVLCTDGVVVGSDSSATLSSGQWRTIEQPVKKIFIVGDDLIFAGAGQAGLGQRFEDILARLRADLPFPQIGHWQIAKAMCASTLQDFASTKCPPGQFGALVAFACASGFHLCEFALTNFQPEFKTPKAWFVSMGSGQAITDPFLGFLRRVLFQGNRPNLEEGLFAVAWALEHAIELNPGGINGPAQIAVLTKKPEGLSFTALNGRSSYRTDRPCARGRSSPFHLSPTRRGSRPAFDHAPNRRFSFTAAFLTSWSKD
jgi:20S proteasome alpha/beta subunit